MTEVSADSYGAGSVMISSALDLCSSKPQLLAVKFQAVGPANDSIWQELLIHHSPLIESANS